MNNTSLTTFEFINISSRLLQDGDCPPIMVWGPTGSGKSATVRETVQRISDQTKIWKPNPEALPSGALEVLNNWGLIDLRVSLLEPSDLLGLPDLGGTTVRWVAPDQLPIIGQAARFPERGVLFLDELNHAQPAMQNACFSLVLDRRCGPHRLLPGWRIVAASNCADENTGAFPMSAPLRNRFVHFHIRCSLDAFKQWGFENHIDPRIIAFLNWNPGALHQSTQNTEESFPTPRSWANTSRILTKFSDGLEPAIAACVGPGTATMFMGFLALHSSADLLVDVLQVLRGKAKPPRLAMERPDQAWAFCGRVTAAVQEMPNRLSVAIGFYCSPAWEEAREIGLTGLTDLKYLVPTADFNQALEPHLVALEKNYGALLE